MAIPKLKKQDVIDALKFIDENGVPEHNTSVKYVLVSEDGKKYPPKYVVAVADHLANSTDISTESFNSVDAKNYLKSLGFSIETNNSASKRWQTNNMHIEDRLFLCLYELEAACLKSHTSFPQYQHS